MEKQRLHITNGSNLTDYLKDLDFKGEILTWEEMLCEGPVVVGIESEDFLNTRKAFLNSTYDIEIDEFEFKEELKKLDCIEKYSEIVLWFEYDLFCHINLLGVINLLQQKKIKLPLYLVCSGRIKGETGLKGLSELKPNQLLKHYKERIKLTDEDIDMAITLWKTYCGKDHNLLKPYIVKKSSFTYMSNCLKAHLERFPSSKNGLCALEENILKIVHDNKIKSRHHLLGYALNYQGYYGFGDIQLDRIIDKLSIFFTQTEDSIKLNRKGHEALIGHHNFSSEVNNNMKFGGINKLDFQFNKDQNKLIKTILNPN
ncbi:MAG TPA: DUF1835 domain-containing protein [Flavobacteriaceae bacterium]|nr:DUF1835 domain-containing protein [Flavobacteriaceae bacterium]